MSDRMLRKSHETSLRLRHYKKQRCIGDNAICNTSAKLEANFSGATAKGGFILLLFPNLAFHFRIAIKNSTK
ncbi:611_t:CDS:2 [Cetraspora pellucida]|uniref:611_t:CDS:1 n=1 Tax=Cetraspora pellucida TaxID=1433469 RepID=A0A9N9ID58_9GLOM|nr:611_t:CDS:2 [Cetraspora pellucida]